MTDPTRDLIRRLRDDLVDTFSEEWGIKTPMPHRIGLLADADAFLAAHSDPLAESPAEEMITMPRSVWELFQRHFNSSVPERYCPTHGQQPSNAWGCPECVRELRQQAAHPGPDAFFQLVTTHEEEWYPAFAEWLERNMPEGTVIGDPLWWASKIADYLARYGHRPAPESTGAAKRIQRYIEERRKMLGIDQHCIHALNAGCDNAAALTTSDLLELIALARWGYQPPQPIPLSERLPLPEECDAQGRCWLGYRERTVDAVIFGETLEKFGPTYPAEWVFNKMPVNPEEWSEPPVIWLPAHALPLPTVQPQSAK